MRGERSATLASTPALPRLKDEAFQAYRL